MECKENEIYLCIIKFLSDCEYACELYMMNMYMLMRDLTSKHTCYGQR